MPRKKKQWAPSPDDYERVNRLRAAIEQVEAVPGGRLGWVCQFVREEPGRWLPGELESHAYRLLAITSPSIPASLLASPWMVPPSRREVLALHTELRKTFHTLLTKPHVAGEPLEMVSIPTTGLRTRILRTAQPGERGQFSVSRSGPFRVMLWQAIATMIQGVSRLIACPVCERPFLALRKMKYCSPKCTQRWWDRAKVKAKQKGV